MRCSSLQLCRVLCVEEHSTDRKYLPSSEPSWMTSPEYILSAHALCLYSSFREVFDFYCETINHYHFWHLRCFPQLNTMSSSKGRRRSVNSVQNVLLIYWKVLLDMINSNASVYSKTTYIFLVILVLWDPCTSCLHIIPNILPRDGRYILAVVIVNNGPEFSCLCSLVC